MGQLGHRLAQPMGPLRLSPVWRSNSPMWAAKYHLLGGMFIIQGMVGDLQGCTEEKTEVNYHINNNQQNRSVALLCVVLLVVLCLTTIDIEQRLNIVSSSVHLRVKCEVTKHPTLLDCKVGYDSRCVVFQFQLES